MARPIEQRVIVSGALEALTPIHVGGAGDSAETSLPLAVDGRGRYYVPGTSLAGALRAFCAGLFPDGQKADLLESLWGYWPRRRDELPTALKERRKEEEKQHASFLIVEDAAVHLPSGAIRELRDGVGIDRLTGAAADKIKYDRAVLPRGTRLDLRLILEIGKPKETDPEPLVAALVTALESEEVCLGAARTRGLGLVTLRDKRIDRQIVNTRRGILDVLRGHTAASTLAAAGHFPARPPRLDITVRFRPIGPLMVKAGYDGVGVYRMPLVSWIDGRLAPVLPGSSVKGALRSHAERIVRTLQGKRADGPFLTQIRVDLVDELFGAAGEPGETENGSDPQPGLAALAVRDCYAKTLRLDRDRWTTVVAASKEKLHDALDRAGAPGMQQAFHVAVDRWTGGAAERLLYSVLEPHGVTWEPLRLRVDLARTHEDSRAAAIALLLLVLQDMGRGRIPLGYSTHRGMGAIAIDEVAIEGQGALPDDLTDLTKVAFPGGKIDSRVAKALQGQWEKFTGTSGGAA